MSYRTCALCGGPLPEGSTSRRMYCSRKCLQKVTYRRRVPRSSVPNVGGAPCAQCGKDIPIRSRSGPAPIYCGATCANKASYERRKLAGSIKRTRKRTSVVEPIVNAEIFERDGWVCQLCDAPVDRLLSYPDPGSASLDHIMPLSRGGHHVRSNVQLAHLFCNLSKGARAA